MPRIYRLSKTGTRLLYKIRHHKGHGIHSPFVFNFITRVIEEKAPYYAYDDIYNYLENFPEIKHNETKLNRFSFRVVNYFNAKKILELGAGDGINTLYITSVSSDIDCLCIETNQEKYDKAGLLFKNWDRKIILLNEIYPQTNCRQDCIFVNLRNYIVDDPIMFTNYLLSLIKEDSFIFLDGIRTNRKQQMLWKSLIELDCVSVSLDLFHLGILFFDKKYFKRNYKLSF